MFPIETMKDLLKDSALKGIESFESLGSFFSFFFFSLENSIDHHQFSILSSLPRLVDQLFNKKTLNYTGTLYFSFYREVKVSNYPTGNQEALPG